MNWIEELSPGDEVVLSCRSVSGPSERVEVVEKVLKNHIVVRGRKFRKSTGVEVGSDSYSFVIGVLHEGTPEKIASVRRNIRRFNSFRRLQNLVESAISDDKLARIMAILAEEQEAE